MLLFALLHFTMIIIYTTFLKIVPITLVNNLLQILFVIATSAMLLTVATGKDDQLSRKFPTNINFYKLFSESAPCNPIYGDYESCENSQRYFNYEYGSEEENVSKQKLDLLAAEEKRGHGHARAGCDCQLSVYRIFFLK